MEFDSDEADEREGADQPASRGRGFWQARPRIHLSTCFEVVLPFAKTSNLIWLDARGATEHALHVLLEFILKARVQSSGTSLGTVGPSGPESKNQIARSWAKSRSRDIPGRNIVMWSRRTLTS